MSEITPLHGDLPIVNLHPGELFVAKEPTLISTILGSCVSVCLYCPALKAGAMCHGVMPSRRNDKVEDNFRFVDRSVAYMVDVMGSGLACVRLEAKIFGGADVLSLKMGLNGAKPSIGAQNIAAARSALRKYGVPIAVERVGGDSGCKLYFYSHTGEVYLRAIPRIIR